MSLLHVLLIAASSSAQIEPSDSQSEAERHSSHTPTEASLERIRSAIQVERRVGLSGDSRFDRGDAPWRLSPRPASRLLPGLDIRGGVDFIGDADRIVAPVQVPLGGPTHQDMMDFMTPRALTQAARSDVRGIATAAPLALLLPQAIRGLKAIGGWFLSPDEAPNSQNFPTLGSSAIEDACDAIRAEAFVIDAALTQHGRTVSLSLVVSVATQPETARTLGERFVGLVKTAAMVEPNPNTEIGTGEFDYIVHISSPDTRLIAQGRKTTIDTQLQW